MGTKIEWVRNDDGKPGETWNPASGCSKVSSGCKLCYGERLSKRIYQGDKWKPWTAENVNTNLRVHPERFRQPFRWYEPRKIFTCSMGDLFHKDLPHGLVPDIFGIMGAAHWHSFFVLTKRPELMAERLVAEEHAICRRVLFWSRELYNGKGIYARKKARLGLPPWPLQNVIAGTSVEDQKSVDGRIRHLVWTPAAKRFVSCEPQIGSIDLSPWLGTCPCGMGFYAAPELHSPACHRGQSLDWIICGGESGPRARPFDLDWARDLRDQCAKARIPFFLKQLGTHWARKVGAKSYKGSDPAEWPEDLRVREMSEGVSR